MKLLFLSGAGISAPSGISTFRDANGLWENHKIDEVANLSTWRDNYDLVHNFYNQRRVELGKCLPNKAHSTIADFHHRHELILNTSTIGKLKKKYDVVNITQNVDDLFERASVPTIDLHGKLTEIKCTRCKSVEDIGYTEYLKTPCKACGHTQMKPYVVFFGEMAPLYTKLYDELESLTSDDFLIVIGTNGNVLPINQLVIASYGVKILNNMEQNEWIDSNLFHHVFYESCETAIDKIKELIEE